MNKDRTDTLAERLRNGLLKIGLAVKAQSWKRANEHRLTPTQSEILSLLNSNRHAGARLGTIAEALAVSSATASDAVTALVRKGHVEKSLDARDSRAISLNLTLEGGVIAEHIASSSDLLLDAIDGLNPQEQAILYRCLIKLIRSLQQKGAIPVSRMCVTCTYFKAHAYADSDSPHHCNYVDAPIGDKELRLECDDHAPADPQLLQANGLR